MSYKYSLIKSGLEQAAEYASEKAPENTSGASTAIIVVHGMGQQTRFETLALFAENLGKNFQKENKLKEAPEYKIILDKFGDESYLACAESEFTGEDKIKTNVHIYESYWAPLTEGKVKFYDIILFFISSCFSSILRYFKEGARFKRKIFDKVIETKVGLYTLILLAITFLLVSGIGYAVYSLPELTKWFMDGGTKWKSLLVLVLLGIIYGIRWVFIQYVGDVCAYISPYKSFKFQEIRDSIQKAAYGVFKFVYSKKSGEKNYYDKIIIVAHSLGTVISYDILNSLIRNDTMYDLKLDVPERTKALITFGSPLDKIVYNFQNQQEKLQLREGILLTLQPMVCNYSYRPVKWINIFSNMDIVSGRLDYYDDGTKNPRAIDNIEDKESRRPLLAHVQYWEKKLLYKKVLENI